MMNRTLTFAIALGGLVFSAFAAEPALFSKIKVDADLYSAPTALYKGGGVSYGLPTKTHVTNKWLMIKVEFTPALEKNIFSAVSQRSGETHLSTRGWLDNVVLSVRVLFDTGIPFQKKTIYGLFSGKICFWSIRQDGQKHMALMFVPAQLIDRYWSGNSANGFIRQATKNNFIIEAEFSCDGTVLGKAYCNLSGAKPLQQQMQFAQLLKNVPAQFRIEESILPKSRSPWADYYPDAYDCEKELSTKK